MADHQQYNLEEPSAEQQDFTSAGNIIRTDQDLVIKNYFNFTNTEAQFLRGQKVIRKGIGTTYSMALSDFLVGVTSLADAPTIGLPRPKFAGAGKIFVVKDEVGGAATTTITVVSQGEEKIDGASSLSITTNYAAYSFYTDGANWFIY